MNAIKKRGKNLKEILKNHENVAEITCKESTEKKEKNLQELIHKKKSHAFEKNQETD